MKKFRVEREICIIQECFIDPGDAETEAAAIALAKEPETVWCQLQIVAVMMLRK